MRVARPRAPGNSPEGPEPFVAKWQDLVVPLSQDFEVTWTGDSAGVVVGLVGLAAATNSSSGSADAGGVVFQ